jgi:hypothetical protein
MLFSSRAMPTTPYQVTAILTGMHVLTKPFAMETLASCIKDPNSD